jgi:hypothetical protein
MQALTENQVTEFFREIKENIPLSAYQAHKGLDDIKPLRHEIDCLEWRYRLRGFTEGLSASNLLDISVVENLGAALFMFRSNNLDERPGRKYKYSVDIKTEQNKVFTFDVPAMNPVDAYVQLTKRIAYKAIPGITTVAVFAGLEATRLPSATPLKTFEKNELVFVSLV